MTPEREKTPALSPAIQSVQFQSTSLPDIIELRNIRQFYPGRSTPVIDGLNFLVEEKPNQGQFLCLLGQSGCGKSTLLRYIAGLQEPSSGEVLLYGKPRTEKDVVGMVFQQYSSLPWMTVLDNVALPLTFKGTPKKQAREQAMEMIKAVELVGHEHKFAQYPTLSGGQLQRVAIARSLISNPKIILMDEPFGALDTQTRGKMQYMLAGLWEKLHSTIVFVTHDIAEAVFLGDDIFVMAPNPGRIANYVHVDLPLHRDRSTKRDRRFIELVDEVEDVLMSTTA